MYICVRHVVFICSYTAPQQMEVIKNIYSCPVKQCLSHMDDDDDDDDDIKV